MRVSNLLTPHRAFVADTTTAHTAAARTSQHAQRESGCSAPPISQSISDESPSASANDASNSARVRAAPGIRSRATSAKSARVNAKSPAPSQRPIANRTAIRSRVATHSENVVRCQYSSSASLIVGSKRRDTKPTKPYAQRSVFLVIFLWRLPGYYNCTE